MAKVKATRVPRGTATKFWSTRKMPVELLERMRIAALQLQIPVQQIVNDALEIGLPKIERRADEEYERRHVAKASGR